MSHSQLYRKIKALTGQSIAAYIRSYRLHQTLGAAATLLVAGPTGVVPAGAKVAWLLGILLLAALRWTVAGRFRGERFAVAGLVLVVLYIGAMSGNGALARARVLDASRGECGPGSRRTGQGPVLGLQGDRERVEGAQHEQTLLTRVALHVTRRSSCQPV